MDGMTWDGAACAQVDPDLWFPEMGSGANTTRHAVAVCRQCPLIHDCLAYALPRALDGIWGGTTEGQRRRMRADLGITATRKDAA